uniref:Cg7 protein n=1 Tax=Strongyloides papillosus TaxID=174720 RepID=A0A0N5BTT8_STREA
MHFFCLLYFSFLQYFLINVSGRYLDTKPIIKTFILHRIVDGDHKCEENNSVLNNTIYYKPYFFTYSNLHRQLVNYYYIENNKTFSLNDISEPIFYETIVRYLKFDCDVSRNIKCAIKPDIVALKFFNSGKKYIQNIEVVLKRTITSTEGETKTLFEISTFPVDKCIDVVPGMYYVFGPEKDFFYVTREEVSL